MAKSGTPSAPVDTPLRTSADEGLIRAPGGAWEPLPERRIALLRMPQLQVDFAWNGLDAQQRYRRQRFFDLSTQRGGG